MKDWEKELDKYLNNIFNNLDIKNPVEVEGKKRNLKMKFREQIKEAVEIATAHVHTARMDIDIKELYKQRGIE